MSDDFRTEHDSMGEVQVPADALWRAQTQRAVENFPISGVPIDRALIGALASIKGAAAAVNAELGVLDAEVATAIHDSAAEVARGDHDAHFPIDVFQTGSGTSSNMNANEVIATLATRRLGRDVHPNDHVNASQSSNDVFPSAIHIAATRSVVRDLVPALEHLEQSLQPEVRGVQRGRQERPDAPDGRHAGDSRPGVRRLRRAGPVRRSSACSRRCPGSASCRSAAPRSAPASTCRPGSRPGSIGRLADDMDLPLTEARDHFEAQGARDALVELSGQLRTVAVSLTKICNDLRWMGSGPRTGLAEIALPDLQPGSSIMPGKVNPVICEATLMVCAQVIGNDTAVTVAGASGNFELNVMMPVLARNVLESLRLLSNASRLLADRCIDGITADVERLPRDGGVVAVGRDTAQPLHRLRGRGEGGEAVAGGAQDDPAGRARARSRRARRADRGAAGRGTRRAAHDAPVSAPAYWAPGETILWRYTNPRHPNETVRPVRVVRDDADGLVAWLAAGTPLLRPVLADGSDLRAVPVAERFDADRHGRANRLDVLARPRDPQGGAGRCAVVGLAVLERRGFPRLVREPRVGARARRP